MLEFKRRKELIASLADFTPEELKFALDEITLVIKSAQDIQKKADRQATEIWHQCLKQPRA